MAAAPVGSSLSQRLLVAATRCHLTGDPPPDWAALAERAQVRARPAVINRTLSALAGQGMIEGLCTPSGWLSVRPTARGIARAGRAGRIDDGSEAHSQNGHTPDVRVFRTGSERVSAAVDQLSGEVRTLSAYSRSGLEWTRRTLPPRVAAWRTSMVQAWRMFTTFP
jgi:hypothetical protein